MNGQKRKKEKEKKETYLVLVEFFYSLFGAWKIIGIIFFFLTLIHLADTCCKISLMSFWCNLLTHVVSKVIVRSV